jgi:hypothetical protein
MKKAFYLLMLVVILAASCNKQPVSTISTLAGTYTWSGVDTAVVIADTNIHFDTTAFAITDTSFSIKVLNDSQVVVSIFGPIYMFDGEVLYNQLGIIETNKTQQTMTFYAPPYIGYNFYCTSPTGNVAARTEYLTYNYGNHTLAFDCYLIDDSKQRWTLHLRSSGK